MTYKANESDEPMSGAGGRPPFPNRDDGRYFWNMPGVLIGLNNFAE